MPQGIQSACLNMAGDFLEASPASDLYGFQMFSKIAMTASTALCGCLLIQSLFWTRSSPVTVACQVAGTNQYGQGFLGSQSEPREVISPNGRTVWARKHLLELSVPKSLPSSAPSLLPVKQYCLPHPPPHQGSERKANSTEEKLQLSHTAASASGE